MTYLISAFLFIHCIYLFQCKDECSKTICNPKAGDLLIGRESFLRASSTCGLNAIESYCVVTPSDSTRKSKCNFCYSKDPYQKFSSKNSHRIENVVSRLPQDPNRWWQSENGIHNVSIEISFESEFQFTYTQLRFKTYRPAAMFIERSKDYGRTWEKYAYFSESCERDFPNVPERKRNNISEILCTSEFSSIIPSEGGTVLFSADTSDWHTGDLFWNKQRNDITAITNLRVQFVKLHTFGDWKIDDSPNVRNKYYYAISEWIIRGRCSCYGHASRCRPKEGQIQIKEMVYGVCECEHNTKGQHCEKCADFYNDSPWLPADKKSTNACRKCDCNNHATSCHFNPVVYLQSENKSGGVCVNCQHNTESKNCERCKGGYYRNSRVAINSPKTCLKCQCNSQGTTFSQLCVQETEADRNLLAGSCICKENVDGTYCDKCKIGFWKFDGKDEKGCTKCRCLMMGTINSQGCDSINGNCYCKTHVMKDDCSTCKNGYFNLSASNPDGCSPCKCSEYGSVETQVCDKFSGQCKCKNGYSGKTCTEIKPEWYVEEPRYHLKYKEETKIELPPVSNSGYYNFIITMDTQQMQILESYVIFLNIKHDKPSSCQDFQDTMVLMSDSKYIVVPNKCLERNLPITITINVIVEPSDKSSPPAVINIIVVPMLDVNSTRTRNVLADCLKYDQSSLPKHCDFLNVETSSKIISKDEPKRCNCNVTGSINNICNKLGGQCSCLPNVDGKNCDKCVQNSYGFDARGCKMCNCEPSGSLNLQCSSDTGKCLCRKKVEGLHCDSCKSGYWNFPFCDSCKCNHMADICDQKTGRCSNCRGNSFGFNCQQCNNGYYGDPGRGIPCSKCSCPSIDRNNSIGCSLIFNTTTYFCICKPGYAGRFCDSCDTNYFGNPLSQYGACKRCVCSGNINSRIPLSCDTRTGECKKCLYNTAGFNCEKCAPGYFGDGVSRTCKKCVCNRLGTNLKSEEICNHESGICPCLPNVIGQQCDQCQNNFYNISSKTGCTSCQCDYPIGAVNQMCNKLTGQCQCHSTRSGLKCDNCKDEYWGDPRISHGCKECICNSEGSLYKQCDRNNGECRCKPGITGKYCDKCMNGTHGQMPNCTSCGSCWLEWNNAIENIERSAYSIANNSLTNRRKTQYPKEINVIFNSINEYLNLSKSIMAYFPNGLEKTVGTLELKLIGLRKVLEQLNFLDFDLKQFSYSEIENRITSAKELVTKNKIKDIEGANNEIKKALILVSNAIYEINKYLQKIYVMRKNLSSQKEDLKNIEIDSLTFKNKELDALLTIMLDNLKTFNGVTCNVNMDNNPLKCSELCGSVGCKPDMCYRNSPINPHCITTTSSFFNSYVRSIEKKHEVEPNLNKLTDYLNQFNSKKISEGLMIPEEEYKTIIKLIGMTNFTVQLVYSQAVTLLNSLKEYNNFSSNEKDFESLVEKISKFDLSFNKEEIKKLEDEISKRKEKLTNVESILDKSKDNRMSCDILKRAAIHAKKNAIYLLLSIGNITANYKKMENYKVKAKELLYNFANFSKDLENKLIIIATIQNKTEAKQNDVSTGLDKILSIESKIRSLMMNFSTNLSQLKEKHKQNILHLKTVKGGVIIIRKKKDDIVKENEISKAKLSQATQELFSRIQKLYSKIKANQQKLLFEKQILLKKQADLNNLGSEIDSKLARLASLQEKIYAKSEFHAKCLP